MNKGQKITCWVGGAFTLFMIFIVQPEHDNGEVNWGANFIIFVAVFIISSLAFYFLKDKKK